MNLLFERVKLQAIVERVTELQGPEAAAEFVADAVARQLATHAEKLRRQASADKRNEKTHKTTCDLA